MTDREVLEMFLSYDLSSAKDVLDKFMTLDNAQYYEHQDYPSLFTFLAKDLTECFLLLMLILYLVFVENTKLLMMKA